MTRSSRRTEHRPGVLVVGGGYAGLHAVRAVEALDVHASVIDRTGGHDFVTRLAAVAGGTATVEDAGRPLVDFVDDVDVGTVVEVTDGAVRLADGRRITADAVVVTAGSEPSRPTIEGIEHAAPLRSAADALGLRERIAHASSVVIVGGGASGVQLAGAAAHAHPDLVVHLVEAEHRLLAGLPEGLGVGAARILGDRGVHVHLGRGVERITADGVVLDGEVLRGLVVWAGGFRADAARLGVPTADDGRIRVDRYLRIAGMERTFAAGDIAAHVDRAGRPLPMSAQIAVRAGTAAGRNAARVVRGEPTDTVDLRQLGWVLDLGGRRGLAQVGPIAFADPFADLVPPLLHELIDVKNLLEIGGLGALRVVAGSVRRIVPGAALAGSAAQAMGRVRPVGALVG